MWGRRRGELIDEVNIRDGDVRVIENAEDYDIDFSVRVLADLLTCHLCSGLFREATTLKECLHTFCFSCLASHILRQRRQCPYPGCHEALSQNPRDCIVRDTVMQNCVDKLFPEFVKKETVDRVQFYRHIGRESILKSEEIKAADSMKEEVTANNQTSDEAPPLSKRIKTEPPGFFTGYYQNNFLAVIKEEDVSITLTPGDSDTLQSVRNVVKEIYSLKTSRRNDEVIFTPARYRELLYSRLWKKSSIDCENASLPALERPHLRLSGNITVQQLHMFLTVKLSLENAEMLELFCRATPLCKAHALKFVKKAFWRDDRTAMQLTYRLNQDEVRVMSDIIVHEWMKEHKKNDTIIEKNEKIIEKNEKMIEKNHENDEEKSDDEEISEDDDEDYDDAKNNEND
eukprot:GHVL01030226.1.p1 GENE.GHVL01030226.1~~GHVL01030226.1.p1  ORF type:complete len:400 (-),score=93.73 GHVL01030226.1:74-1273(-)